MMSGIVSGGHLINLMVVNDDDMTLTTIMVSGRYNGKS